MRIDKFVHSCLRLTIGQERLLFDPGKFSFVDGRVDPAVFSDVSTIVL
ncbi:MAG: MBL fold metallo-hydrolase, partial [Brevundimonas sp.]